MVLNDDITALRFEMLSSCQQRIDTIFQVNSQNRKINHFLKDTERNTRKKNLLSMCLYIKVIK